MGRVCREIQEWVEQEVERPIENWVNREETRCRTEPCNWWCACCNKWFCWIVVVAVKIVQIIIEIIKVLVTRVICETVNLILDLIGFVFTLILSIPIIGAFIRMVWNWVTEIIWRLVGLLDFGLSLVGVRPRKKMYFGVVVPSIAGNPILDDATIMTHVNATIRYFDATCNVNMIFTGICHTGIEAPQGGLVVNCDGDGFANDFGWGGSYFEFATATCKFQDSFRRIIGLGSELIVFIVQNVGPDSATTNFIGCSFTSTHNYVVIEGLASHSTFVTAHEIGHACWLPHDGDPANLMSGNGVPSTAPVMTNLQISTLRWSKHCVYF